MSVETKQSTFDPWGVYS